MKQAQLRNAAEARTSAGRVAENAGFTDRRESSRAQSALAVSMSERTLLQRRPRHGGAGSTLQRASADPIQRTKARPADDALRAAVARHVSREMGSCCGAAAAVRKSLLPFADDVSQTKAVLLMWIEDGDDVGNHTAATIEWTEGTFVVDTTAGQFGGTDVYVGTLDEWQAMVLGLQTGHVVTSPKRETMDAPMGDLDMMLHAQTYSSSLIKRVDEGKKAPEPPKPAPGKDKDGKSPAKKSRCFLTTACVEHRGLPDDCRELTMLRAFRDGYLSAQREGPALIADYYRCAPALVTAIHGAPDRAQVLEEIYAEITQCVADIDDGDPGSALARYRTMVERLLVRFPDTSSDKENRRFRTA